MQYFNVAQPATDTSPRRWLVWKNGKPHLMTEEEVLANPGGMKVMQVREDVLPALQNKLGKLEWWPAAQEKKETTTPVESLGSSRYGDREEIVVRWPNGGEAPIEGGRTKAETDEIIKAMNESYERQGMPQRAYRKDADSPPKQTETQAETQVQENPQMAKDQDSGFGFGKATNILTKPWQKAIAPYIAVLYIFLFIGVFFVALWNIGPYEVAARFIGSRFESSAIVGFVLGLPVLGLVFRAIGNLIFWIIGFVVWAVIQLIELLPIVMTHNPGYVRSVLMEQEAHESLRPDKNDPGVVRYLKKFYNQFPMRFLVIARRLRVWVYVLDMLIVMMVYPPVREGGIGRFFFLLSTGQWGQFDWVNIILMFVTLFAMEAVVKLLMIVKHFRDYLKATKRQPAAA